MVYGLGSFHMNYVKVLRVGYIVIFGCCLNHIYIFVICVGKKLMATNVYI